MNVSQTGASWIRLDANTFTRTKTKGGVTTSTTYSTGAALGAGLFGQVCTLRPIDDTTKKCKALKVCNPSIDPLSMKTDLPVCKSLIASKFGMTADICSVEKEYDTLLKLPKSPGLPKPPKAFFPHELDKNLPACFIMHRYDFNFNFDSSEAADLPLNEFIETAIQLCSGLKELHSKKIAHRDLDVNIMSGMHAGRNIMYDKSKKQAALVDFGEARMLESAPPAPRIKSEFELQFEKDLGENPEWKAEFEAQEAEFLALMGIDPHAKEEEKPLTSSDKESIKEDFDGLKAILRFHSNKQQGKSDLCEKNVSQRAINKNVCSVIEGALKKDDLAECLVELKKASELFNTSKATEV